MADVFLEPWSEADLPLLQKLLGDPNMMAHLGGPETPEQILRRHRRYVRLREGSIDHMFKIVWAPGGEGVGSIGYWRRNWHDRPVYEMGWLVLMEHQGRGIATNAGRALLERVCRKPRYQFMHAFPSVDNAASNAICRKLGFTLMEQCRLEYPPGRSMTVNDWRLGLSEKYSQGR